jgi:predicted HTH transcriptional regulator
MTVSLQPTSLKLRVFISSVQKELIDEREQLKVLLGSDPFLVRHTVPKLFEKYPAPLRPNPKAYLELLRNCHTRLAGGEELTSAGLQKDFAITRDTVVRDMAALLELGRAAKIGKARATRYVYATPKSSEIVR